MADATKVQIKEELSEDGIVLTVENTDAPMHAYSNDSKEPPLSGDIIAGKVLALHKNSVFVDLPPFGTGIIYGREYSNARDMIKNIAIGDEVTGTIIDVNNADGYIELSLKEARQALIWGEAEKAVKEKKQFSLIVKEANKGGLILEWQGIAGFLPASQLTADHYPRVDGGDKERILEELQRLVGKPLTVALITADPKEGKLIFSEKGIVEKDKEVLVGRYNVGDEVEGEVTGIVDFGIFIKIENGLEGLAHISELDWGLVEDPRKIFTVGEKLRAKVIEVKDGKVSLSVKALKENPWVSAGKKYAKDDVVEAVVIKYNKHGALASIEEGVAGLVHVSEFESIEKLRAALELGKSYTFKINVFDPKEQRMTLSYAPKK
ncbi:MAG: S1 RNA-binding domain-containing protein [Candidatus Pacebacteria bacterium]|nr:S1 RNA-binding domain-containing protein [Candidatus Paceibacterota bacterium]